MTTPTTQREADERAQNAVHIFTCKGKGGEYELIGYSNGAGPKRGESIVVYRDTSKPDILYHRSADDFRERMEWLGARASLTPTAPAEQVDDAMRQRVRDAVAGSLTSLYHCGRVWSAWGYGTMHESDFSPAAEDDDIIENIASAAIDAMATPTAPQAASQQAGTNFRNARTTVTRGFIIRDFDPPVGLVTTSASLDDVAPAAPQAATTASASTIKTWQERTPFQQPWAMDATQWEIHRAKDAEITDLRAALARAPLPGVVNQEGEANA